MKSPANFVQPPRIATWLVSLFAPYEGADSILGDLLEEYFQLVSSSGVSVARRWYWRQTLQTIAHLFGAGLRGAPWSTAAAVIGGFFLRRFVSGLPDRLLSVVTDRYLMFWSAHFNAYIWMLDGMRIEHLIASMFVGCVLALAAKRREMIASTTLALVLISLMVAALAWVAAHQSIDVAWSLWPAADPFAIIVGAAIVRTRRLAATTPLPSEG
jgi:hypothetical protein